LRAGVDSPRRTTRGEQHRARTADKGASLAEFAIVLPLLFALLLGTVEFSWVLGQYLDLRHGAREGARMAAVNYPEGDNPPDLTRDNTNTLALRSETCSRMNIASGIEVTFQSSGGEDDPITVTASAPARTLTALLAPLFSSMTLSSTIVLHAEQPATWGNTVPGEEGC
jgi:Flp pilus assembly protein TadG